MKDMTVREAWHKQLHQHASPLTVSFMRRSAHMACASGTTAGWKDSRPLDHLLIHKLALPSAEVVQHAHAGSANQPLSMCCRNQQLTAGAAVLLLQSVDQPPPQNVRVGSLWGEPLMSIAKCPVSSAQPSHPRQHHHHHDTFRTLYATVAQLKPCCGALQT